MKNLFAAFALLAMTTLSHAGSLTDSEMVQMQAAMQSHIDGNAVGGALLRFDEKSGTVVEAFSTKAHPKIMTMGEHYVMCADFMDTEGKAIMANFYMARDGQRYVVYHTTWGDDPALMALMKAGKLQMAN